MKFTKKRLSILAIASVFIFYAFSESSRYFQLVKNIEVYAKVYKELNETYVDDVEPSKLMRHGVDAMLKTLDPYTNYISEGQIEGYRLQNNSAAGDIGVDVIKQGKYIVISEIYENLPAQNSELKVGDKILAVNGTKADGRTVYDVQKILQGQPGSMVTLKIKRPNEAQEKIITVQRDKNKVTSVPYYGMLDEETAYIKLRSFTQRCSNEVAKALEELQTNHEVKSLVLDLRHNGGGLLSEAINMVNLFVPKGELVVYTQGRLEDWKKEYKTKQEPMAPDLPLVVLVDGRSASASEIVSGTIQDLDRGIVIGERSFGKGLVQQTKNIGYNSKIKLTVAKYYNPSGRCVQAVDYSGRYKDGVVTVPDSLRTAFKTRNGRKVYDGGGVDPDINIESKLENNVMQGLIKKQLIFDYATLYQQKHPTIDSVGAFKLTDKDFESFVQYVKKQNFDYETRSEKILAAFKKSAEKEKYKEAVDGSLTELEAKIKKEKGNDLYKFKGEILKLLKSEIIVRYYYQNGKAKGNLNDDDYIKASLSVLKDDKRYDKILSGDS